MSTERKRGRKQVLVWGLALSALLFALLGAAFLLRERSAEHHRPARVLPSLDDRESGKSTEGSDHSISSTGSAPTRVRGIVIDTCGIPISGARVREMATGSQVVAGPDATFAMELRRSPTELRLLAEIPGLGVLSPEHRLSSSWIGEKIEVEVLTAPFDGFVFEESTGAPISGAEVTLVPDVGSALVQSGTLGKVAWPLRARSDASGSFGFRHVPCAIPGTPEYLTALPYKVIVVSGSHRNLNSAFTVRAATMNSFPFYLFRGRSVRVTGTVRNHRGEFVEGALVVVLSRKYRTDGVGQMRSETVRTDREGRFEIAEALHSRAGGDGYVRFIGISAADFAPLELEIGADPECLPGPHRITLTPGLTIRGRVVDDSGRGVAGAVVAFCRTDAPLPESIPVNTDSEGRFSCTGLGPYTYDVVVNADPKREGGWDSSLQTKESVSPPLEDLTFTFVRRSGK